MHQFRSPPAQQQRIFPIQCTSQTRFLSAAFFSHHNYGLRSPPLGCPASLESRPHLIEKVAVCARGSQATDPVATLLWVSSPLPRYRLLSSSRKRFLVWFCVIPRLETPVVLRRFLPSFLFRRIPLSTRGQRQHMDTWPDDVMAVPSGEQRNFAVLSITPSLLPQTIPIPPPSLSPNTPSVHNVFFVSHHISPRCSWLGEPWTCHNKSELY